HPSPHRHLLYDQRTRLALPSFPTRRSSDLINRCKRARVLTVIKLTQQGLRQIGIAEPRIAVAGLNPHAGEGGLFGHEEIEEIERSEEHTSELQSRENIVCRLLLEKKKDTIT